LHTIFKIIKSNIIGISIGIIGLISSSLSYLFIGNLDKDMISYRVFFIILTFLLIIIVTQFVVIVKIIQLPLFNDIIRVKSYNNRIDEFITDPSHELSINTIACLYFVDGDYDIFVGIGTITNSTSKVCQLKITGYNNDFIEKYSEVFGRIKSSDINTINCLKVKSQITNEAIMAGRF